MAAPIALVTGAGIGIGRAIARRLGRDGYRVIVTDVLAKDGERVAAQIARAGEAEFHFMDVADTDNVNAVVAAVEKKHRRAIDCIVNNAGITRTMPLTSMSDEDWERIHDVDLKGMLRVVRAAAPRMRKAGRGAIVCLSSIAGYSVGWGEHAPYSAAKAGVAGLVKALAIELAADGIRVNGIAPGVIRSAQTLDPVNSLGPDGLDAFGTTVPLGRIGKPEEIASVTAFLASADASYMTGQVLIVDGGTTIAL